MVVSKLLRNTINGVVRPNFPTLASLQQRRSEPLDLPPQPPELIRIRHPGRIRSRNQHSHRTNCPRIP